MYSILGVTFIPPLFAFFLESLPGRFWKVRLIFPDIRTFSWESMCFMRSHPPKKMARQWETHFYFLWIYKLWTRFACNFIFFFLNWKHLAGFLCPIFHFPPFFLLFKLPAHLNQIYSCPICFVRKCFFWKQKVYFFCRNHVLAAFFGIHAFLCNPPLQWLQWLWLWWSSVWFGRCVTHWLGYLAWVVCRVLMHRGSFLLVESAAIDGIPTPILAIFGAVFDNLAILWGFE